MVGTNPTWALQNQGFIGNTSQPYISSKMLSKGSLRIIFSYPRPKVKEMGEPIYGILALFYLNSLFFIVVVGISTLIRRCSVKGV